MILDLYPEEDHLQKYAYQSGCQNLLSDNEDNDMSYQDKKAQGNWRQTNIARSITP